ncbi:MAG: tetratricopeptide repeat protein, partial [Faecalibacterium sp.]
MKRKKSIEVFVLVCIFVGMLFGCASKAAKALEKVELGQKYLTELNYTEAIASFTEAINLDPENIPAYMGRAQAYRGTEQYAEAKADYTTVIEKTAEQPYTQATALVGRAEVSELTRDDQDALTDYQSASKVLETVEVEKLTDVTEQMLEALKIKVYEACARL